MTARLEKKVGMVGKLTASAVGVSGLLNLLLGATLSSLLGQIKFMQS